MRADIMTALGRRVSPKEVEELLCFGGEGRWDPLALSRRRGFFDMNEQIMAAKEDAERERQREASNCHLVKR